MSGSGNSDAVYRVCIGLLMNAGRNTYITDSVPGAEILVSRKIICGRIVKIRQRVPVVIA
jgi:hypothetical protein